MIVKNYTKYIHQNANVETNGNVVTFEISSAEMVALAVTLRQDKISLKLITATDNRDSSDGYKIWYVFGIPEENIFLIPYIKLKNKLEFFSIADTYNQALNYEKKIRTFFGLTPVGHLDNNPIILHENWPTNIFPLRKDFDWQTRPSIVNGVYKFQEVEGEGIYEIPVGPIHAGIIEPGHFRFSMAGEEIVLLEAKLGFVHKGSEKLFEQLTLDNQIKLSEQISGDTSFSHSLAFCQAIEQLSDIVVPDRAKHLRVIFSELERLANHFGDIGAMMLDTGFNFGGSNGARLRETIMQINERLTGHRFLRGVNTIGGVTKDINDQEINKLINDLVLIEKDFSEVIAIAENSAILFNRFKDTGAFTYDMANNLGIIGIAGRCVGINNDTRKDYPYAAYKELGFDKIETQDSGDAYARFMVRIKEAYASMNIITKALNTLPAGDIIKNNQNITLKNNAVVISIVEGWRGEIVYFITTDASGKVNRVFPRDPSFINWSVVGTAGFGNVVLDFPIINKSFNLSYSGNDL